MSNLESLFDLVGVLARRRYASAERHFAKLGLNHSEARLLTLLREAGGEAPQEDLSSKLVIDRTNAGRALQSLERQGFVERRPDAADKRAKLVRLSAKGARVAVSLIAVRQEMSATFFGRLSERDAGRIVDLLTTAISETNHG